MWWAYDKLLCEKGRKTSLITLGWFFVRRVDIGPFFKGTCHTQCLPLDLSPFLQRSICCPHCQVLVAWWITRPHDHKPMQGDGRSCSFLPKSERLYLPKQWAIFATPFQMASIRLSVVQTYGNLTLPNGDWRQMPLLIVDTWDNTETD